MIENDKKDFDDRVFEPWISFSNIVEVNKALFKNQILGQGL